jgi:hypothetical protein
MNAVASYEESVPGDGDGSFCIECEGGDCITLMAPEAAVLQERCAFFANVFNYGTEETLSWVVKKPD